MNPFVRPSAIPAAPKENTIDTTDFPPIIGLYSPVPQSGKTTLADYLTTLGFTRMGHAEPIKWMAETLLFGYTSLMIGEIEETRGPDKDKPLIDTGCSRRDIERAIGCGLRDLISADFWRNVLHARIENSECPVVVDDLRFPNEYAAIREAGGQVWRIERPDSPSWHMATYESESLLEKHDFDAEMVNDGHIHRLYEQADEQLRSPSRAPA